MFYSKIYASSQFLLPFGINMGSKLVNYMCFVFKLCIYDEYY